MRENKPKPADIDLNPEFRRALEIMEEGRRSVFITGRAGTGKSTLLRYFREHERQKGWSSWRRRGWRPSTWAGRRSIPSSASSPT